MSLKLGTTLIAGSTGHKANIDLDNLSLSGKNVGTWSNNIPSCITKIPQDIKLELYSGSIRLLSGSSLYFPNGFESDNTTPKFVKKEFLSDIAFNASSGLNGQYLMVLSGTSDLHPEQLSFKSGNSFPSSPSEMDKFYDISTNKIYRYSGTQWEVVNMSLPLGLVTLENGVPVSIDQVFNGFGYIGSTIYGLPDVQGTYPNGRNDDGTYKFGLYTINRVLTYTNTTATASLTLVFSDTSINGYSNIFYNEEKNIFYNTGSAKISMAIGGTYKRTNGAVNNMVIRQPLRLMDSYSVDEKISQYDGNVVHKSGNETINGTKTFSSKILRTGALSGSATNLIELNDSNNKGKVSLASYYTSNNLYHRLYATNTTAGKDGYIEIYETDSGNTYVNIGGSGTNKNLVSIESGTTSKMVATMGWVNNPSTATNVVHRSDTETIGGIKTFSSNPIIKNNEPIIKMQDENLSKGTAPSSTNYTWVSAIYDKNGLNQANKLAQIYHSYYSNGNTSLNFGLFKPESGSTTTVAEFALNSNGSMTIPTPTDDNTSSNQADTVGARNTKLQSYQTTANLETTLSDSTTKYPSSSAVKSAINVAVSSAYRPAGTVAFSNLPTLSSTYEGYVYNVSDAFTTNANFVEGAGKSYPAGTNVVCINTATSGTAVYKWDVLAGFVDLSPYALDSNVVHKTGDETISGTKTFNNEIVRAATFGSGDTYSIKMTDSNSKGSTGITNYYAGTSVIERMLVFNHTSGKHFYLDVNSKDDGNGYVSISGTATNLSLTEASNSTSSPMIPTKGWVNNPDTATNVVHRSGNETIAGVKTFSAEPVINSNIQFGNIETGTRGIWGKVGNNDYWRVVGGATANNAGYMELATADDYNEPIYVRQYQGGFATIKRTATLLDGSGNTSFPGTVTVGDHAILSYNSSTEALDFIFT